jgi:serine phosphatase RsbU (regulator of sigma subunit)
LLRVDAERLPYQSLTRVAERLASGAELRHVLEELAAATVEATRADLAVVRVRDEPSGMLVARAVAPARSPLAAEVSGSRVDPDELGAELDGGTIVSPAFVGTRIVGSIEAIRTAADFDEDAQLLVELAASQLALACRLQLDGGHAGSLGARLEVLERDGESLAAGAELERSAAQAARSAARATRAVAAAIWRAGDELELIALDGDLDPDAVAEAHDRARAVCENWEPIVIEPRAGRGVLVSIRLGQPAFGVLQLLLRDEPSAEELSALGAYSARVAHVLRRGQRALELEVELDRTRALLAVVGEAIARLSLAHTLETAVERIGDLLALERVGIYLREEGRLSTVAGRGLSEGHEQIAFALLELSLGALRARETIEVRARGGEVAEAVAVRALRAAEVDSALAVPLRFHDETIGLLVAYPDRRRPTPAERALLASLASQLAVVVQNARLHEEAKELGDALGSVLESERRAANRLRALYEISSSFASSLSLETTLETVTRTIVEVLEVDAAVIRVPDERGDLMVAKAVHVADDRLDEAVTTILDRPHAALRLTGPLVLDPARARSLGGAHELLAPFLEKGSTAVVLPIATPAELLAQLTILSLDPASPIGEETVATAVTIAAQAALAIDNARLYQQQKDFAETIQRALLPSERPQVKGLDVGAVYESAARLDVGGDVYDFIELADGRLAIVLGDVTGHGVDATADMAMAKFVFRSLAREHPEPGDFLAAANEVIADEIAVGKFITMTYVALDPRGTVVGASAGHPPPRVVLPDGRVETLACGGLALGVLGGQHYDEARAELPSGASVVLYTDGVIEARFGGELFGEERLDLYLADNHGQSAQALAEGVLAACRAFAGDEVSDDCAVVVARKL